MYAILDLIYIFLAVKGKMEELKLVSNHFIIWEISGFTNQHQRFKNLSPNLIKKFMKEMKI